ncbi:MAG: Fe-S oxidoreductase [Chloroflexi bacterium B3_Chlor]|nr:MAG: Fe-S oxidoreductase [Chloroflexi bacterium B3_Chlor]
METDQTILERCDLWGCIQCGKCTGGCPLSFKTTLNVRRLIYEALVEGDVNPDGMEELWDCTTCGTCVLRCPKEVEPVDVIVALRTELVDGGIIPPTIRDALTSVFRYGNPSLMQPEERADWAEGLGVKSISDGADVLYFVGCIPSYDDRVQKVAKALVKAFHKAEVDFGILGVEEKCCCNEVRRVGEEGLFEYVVEEQQELFSSCNVEHIVTTSPHCFNTFTNEYEGLDIKVQHYTQFVAELIDNGKLAFTGELNKVVTYHDPCFLGKQNAVYDEPRKILQSIPGVEFREMDRTRDRSLCCEGGGGRMWGEGTNPEERLATSRFEEVLSVGADIMAVACPFCLLTFDLAAKAGGYDEKVQVTDIIELVAEVI